MFGQGIFLNRYGLGVLPVCVRVEGPFPELELSLGVEDTVASFHRPSIPTSHAHVCMRYASVHIFSCLHRWAYPMHLLRRVVVGCSGNVLYVPHLPPLACRPTEADWIRRAVRGGRAPGPWRRSPNICGSAPCRSSANAWLRGVGKSLGGRLDLGSRSARLHTPFDHEFSFFHGWVVESMCMGISCIAHGLGVVRSSSGRGGKSSALGPSWWQLRPSALRLQGWARSSPLLWARRSSDRGVCQSAWLASQSARGEV